MFGLFKSDPIKKLKKQYEKKSEEAMNAQRNGKMDVFAELSAEVDKIGKEIDALEIERNK